MSVKSPLPPCSIVSFWQYDAKRPILPAFQILLGAAVIESMVAAADFTSCKFVFLQGGRNVYNLSDEDTGQIEGHWL